MPTVKAKRAIERAFRIKDIMHSPALAFLYDDAEINWKTGAVTLSQGDRKPFIPTASLQAFESYFASALAAPTKNAPATPPWSRRKPTSKDKAEFLDWWAEQENERGEPPTIKDAEQFARGRGISRGWAREQIKNIPSKNRRPVGGQKRQRPD